MKKIISRITVLLITYTLCVYTLFAPAFAQMSSEVILDGIEDSQGIIEKADGLIEKYSVTNLINDFAASLKNAFFGYGKAFASLIFMTLALGIVNTVTGNRAACFAGEVLLCTNSFSILSAVCENVIAFMDSLENFILAMLPIMTTVYSASGAPITAATSYGTTLLTLNICSAIFSRVLLPSVKIIIVLSSITLISRSINLSGFAGFIKIIVSRFFGITMCVMSAAIYFQTVLTVSKDGIASRAVRYAAANVIPVIGGVVSESARTVMESMRLVKSVAGAAGVFSIIGLVTAPLVAVAVCRFFMLLCSSVAKLSGGGKIGAYYDEICEALNLLIGASVGIALIFILMLGIFARITVNL